LKVTSFLSCPFRESSLQVNAYLKQRLGYENIGRLQDGIISYEGYIAAQQEDHAEDSSTQSTFLGKNFLFDRRRLRLCEGNGTESDEMPDQVPPSSQS
jgi:hypothetical protein